MCPASTRVPGHVARALRVLGAQVRAHRKRLRLNATATAEAAGMSRVTLRRIERGESSVTLGAYASVLDALGLLLEVRDPGAMPSAKAVARLPRVIRLADCPQLRKVAWHLGEGAEVSPAEALNLYERQWRHLDPSAMDSTERALLSRLLEAFGRERPLV